MNIRHTGINESDKLEGMTFLGDFYRPQLASPVINVLKEVTMN